MTQTPHPARAAAIRLLTNVLEAQRPLSEPGQALEGLEPADRAAAQRLAAEVLRGLERADRLLKPHLRKTPKGRALHVLRLGAVELAQGGAPHGVVNDCVALVAQSRRSAGFKGLVNAVLRKLGETAPQRWHDLRPSRLPAWLRDPLVAAWGTEAVRAIEAAHAAGAPLDLTAKSDPEEVAQATGGALLSTGSVRLDAGQVSALPGFADGAWWVQDAAAALPVRLLGDVAGARVLDMCAAPGGKTLQLAASGAEVTALDLSAERLGRLHENLARTGLSAHCVTGDALSHEGRYDAVLLDAPCSATGTIRRHPDLPYLHRGERIGALIEQQSAMIDHALALLPPGGRLVYATCSLLPDEGECQIEAALERHPALRIHPPEAPWIETGWRSAEGGLRLRPDHWGESGGLDGFYMACLEVG